MVGGCDVGARASVVEIGVLYGLSVCCLLTAHQD